MPKLRILPVIALLFLVAAGAQARPFGRNKVQYETFDWRVLRTEHLEIHYYPDAEALAERAAEYGEAACRRLDAAWEQTLTKPIPLVVYGSPHHFRQNNVTPSLLGESTGGFTEIFRNRVVLPYSGSEDEFRHVIHHELVHAYVFDRLYGGTLRSLFVLQQAFPIPLWFMEGIAEFYSNEWDSEGEMMIRDAAVQGALPPFQRIQGGYFVYKAGASAVGYLAQRHGEDVIRRILDDLAITRNLALAVKNVTGESLDELGTDWLLETRRRTWPSLVDLDLASQYGRVLSSSAGGIDSHPVLSPGGDRVVFLSTRSGTADLWLADLDSTGVTHARALVRGARGGKFESLHPLRSSVGWSPDERYVVASAQRGGRDALYVLRASDGGTVTELTPELDAIERPDWSPNDARFVFTGMHRGQVDLWLIDADGSGLRRLTDDLHEDRGPRWSPDGTRVLFTSDRSDSTGRDLFTVDVATGRILPLVTEPGDQWDGCWRHDGSIAYATDEWGTRDLVLHDLASGERRRVTRLLGGADSPSAARTGGQLAFTAYEKGRFSIVLVDDPDTLSTVFAEPIAGFPGFWPPAEVEPEGADSLTTGPAEVAGVVPMDGTGTTEPTAWTVPMVDEPEVAWVAPPPVDEPGGEEPTEPEATTGQAARNEAGQVAAMPDPARGEAAIDVAAIDPQKLDYRPRLRPEWLSGSFGYGGFGASLALQTAFTDVLGDHRVNGSANVFRSVRDSDVRVTYTYRKRRIDWNASVFHFRDYLWNDRTTLGQPIGEEGDHARFSERKRGGALGASYPFHTFRRVDFDLLGMNVDRTRYETVGGRREETSHSRSTVLLPSLSHTFDNALWGWTGPIQGSRSVALLQHSVPIGGDELEFTSAMVDVRRYHRFSGEYVLAWRTMVSSSWGADPQEYQLGGPSTLRGQVRQSIRGRNAALASVEYRYPFLDYVKFGWPLRTAFGGVRGDLFLDVGTAFDDPSGARLTATNAAGERALRDLHIGFGVGARARVAYLPLRFDLGWRTDGVSVSEPVFHFFIGPEY